MAAITPQKQSESYISMKIYRTQKQGRKEITKLISDHVATLILQRANF